MFNTPWGTVSKSKRKNKKYEIKAIDGKAYHFGSKTHKHYKDVFGQYKHLDHNDKKRRLNFLKRMTGKSTKKQAVNEVLKRTNGQPSSKLFSILYLW